MGKRRYIAHSSPSDDQTSRKILFLTLIIIIFVAVLGTFTIYSLMSPKNDHGTGSGYATGQIMIEVKPPSQGHIRVGETIANN